MRRLLRLGPAESFSMPRASFHIEPELTLIAYDVVAHKVRTQDKNLVLA